MSRKPTAITMDNAGGDQGSQSSNKAENTRSEKKQPAAAKKITKKAGRKPRAMDAPDRTEKPEIPEATQRIANHLPSGRKGGKWGAVFVSSILALVTLGFGLWVTQTIEGLFARHKILGWVAAGLFAIAVLCLLVIIVREIVGLWRLRKLEQLREEVLRVQQDSSIPAKPILDRIANLYTSRKDMHWHLSRLASHRDDVIDDHDRLALAERYLMKPLDEEARNIIASAAKRVSIVTAVNPAPSLDVIFAGYQILAMLRRLTSLYGNRPGSIGTIKLAGMVGSHLAVTGGLALSDTLMQQFLGKGLAGRLSAKLGEGTVNGIMTARIGIAALDLCRPMPFREIRRPGLREFIATIAGSLGNTSGTDADLKEQQ